MENSFRNKLYQATKPHHQAIEEVFNFKKKITIKNLDLFLRTMLVAREYCQPLLANLEINCGIHTCNVALIKALQKDFHGKDIDLHNEVQNVQSTKLLATDISNQIGVFYVFAGSSAGAKVILFQAKKQAIQHPLHYFNTLVEHSENQMSTFKEITTHMKFIDDQVIEAAQHTFDLIYEIASNELRKRITTV